MGGARSSEDSLWRVLALKVARAKTLRQERTVPWELSIDSGMLVTVLLRVRPCFPVPLEVKEKGRRRSNFDDDGGVGIFANPGELLSP